LTLISAIFILLSGFASLVAMGFDTASYINSKNYCDSGMAGFWKDKPNYSCDFNRYLNTILMDVGAGLLWIITFATIFTHSKTITNTNKDDTTDKEKLVSKRDPNDTNPF